MTPSDTGRAPAAARLHLSEGAVASPASLAAIRAHVEHVNRYPDPDCRELVDAVARRWGVVPERVVISNGSDELLLLCALALGDPSRPGVICEGTFTGHRYSLEVARRGVRTVPLRDGRVDVDAVARAMPGSGMVTVCNPHNPSGTTLEHDELDALVAASIDVGVPLVLDEAYLEFAPPGTASAAPAVAMNVRILTLRTFSKAYGLAGARVGYAVGAAPDVQALRDAQRALPFRVNRLGQEAALAALADEACIENVRAETARRRSWFAGRLRDAGYLVEESVTNFVAVRVRDPGRAAAWLLDEHRVMVRDTTDMGYPGHLRISLGSLAELERTLCALTAEPCPSWLRSR